MFARSPIPQPLIALLAALSLPACAPAPPVPRPADVRVPTGPLPPPPAPVPTDSRPTKSPYSDCDPAAKNSDGTPKKAPPGPPGYPPQTLVLTYDDFGPQASAAKLLGMAWWTWEPGGSFERCDQFDIRVVVYRGLPLARVENEYPTATSRADVLDRHLTDYRYVEYTTALTHLDAELQELATLEGLEDLARDLRTTRRRITDALGH